MTILSIDQVIDIINDDAVTFNIYKIKSEHYQNIGA